MSRRMLASWITSQLDFIDLFIVKDAWKPFLSSRNGLCQVDSLTAPPANATQREATRSRALRGKDQTADCTWPSKHSVHGLVAQKRRAGVLATAGARAWPKAHARRETKVEATVACQKGGIICIPLLIPQPDRERYQFFFGILPDLILRVTWFDSASGPIPVNASHCQ